MWSSQPRSACPLACSAAPFWKVKVAFHLHTTEPNSCDWSSAEEWKEASAPQSLDIHRLSVQGVKCKFLVCWILCAHFCGCVLRPKLREVDRNEKPEKSQPLSVNLNVSQGTQPRKKIINQISVESCLTTVILNLKEHLGNNRDTPCGFALQNLVTAWPWARTPSAPSPREP